jgi:hypothetical protein
MALVSAGNRGFAVPAGVSPAGPQCGVRLHYVPAFGVWAGGATEGSRPPA